MSNQLFTYDVIVIGAGHAGVEAAHAAATLGCKTALVTIDKQKIGVMPCNPSIGGIGKGHIVYEISALGGLMPKLCSKTYLQAHMLNTKKGPAVQGLRLQIDKIAYANLARQELENMQNLIILQEMVDELLVQENKVIGVTCASGTILHSSQVVITTGTFLNGLIHVGTKHYPSGRRDESAAIALPKSLKNLSLRLGRLKTGTPPRIETKTIDFSQLEKQVVEPLDYLFEFEPMPVMNSYHCYIAHTNEKTHDIIRKNLHQSAMYSGNIKGIGPRYCPSIEDKISRFADKKSHHIFVEPETAEYVEVYPSGMSTSLPEDVQQQFITSIKGFENAHISKFGYAVEYDFVYPDQLCYSLETKTISGLFLAGQINGTTGYEEAAGQGIMAGINAALKALKKPAFILGRQESYIGIMIDDLITLGVDEPYRMFTSRAERRLILRQDNVFSRLMPKAYEIGMISQASYEVFLKSQQELDAALQHIDTHYKNAELIQLLEQEPDAKKLCVLLGVVVSPRNAVSVLSYIKYKDYMKRELQEIEKYQKYKHYIMPQQTVIDGAPGISTELKHKIARHKPDTIAAATLIPGMTPAAISLLILLARQQEKQNIK
ncbi:tRNA uridine-5-carboxymethylaminomethyl(34) synthesis enzyme MnmG [Candidatus Dependentiae bacterium]|nr:tRNA uridine-5-carboxymethylaminomethyl(34) synthesis enzyme MnmG [Candidatus Dependentiae bacterium]